MKNLSLFTLLVAFSSADAIPDLDLGTIMDAPDYVQFHIEERTPGENTEILWSWSYSDDKHIPLRMRISLISGRSERDAILKVKERIQEREISKEIYSELFEERRLTNGRIATKRVLGFGPGGTGWSYCVPWHDGADEFIVTITLDSESEIGKALLMKFYEWYNFDIDKFLLIERQMAQPVDGGDATR